MIRLAIAKGRILKQTIDVLEKVGIHCDLDPISSRKLIISTNVKDLEIIVIKATDVPVYIDSGKIDLGIVGIDTLMEDDRNKVWQQAENRLHAQKALLISLLG